MPEIANLHVVGLPFMNRTHTTDWLLPVENQDDLWIILQRYLPRLVAQVQTVSVSNVLTVIKYCQASGITASKGLPHAN